MILKRSDHVVLMPFWKDSPALAWGSFEDPQRVPLSIGAARLIREMYADKGDLSMLSLLGAYGKSTPRVGFHHLFSLARIMYGRGLVGRRLFI